MVTLDGEYYQKLLPDDIKSTADMVTRHLGSYFTERISEEFRKEFNYLLEGEHPVYMDYNGSLYVVTVGMGGVAGIKSIELKAVAKNDDSLLCMVIEKVAANMMTSFTACIPAVLKLNKQLDPVLKGGKQGNSAVNKE